MEKVESIGKIRILDDLEIRHFRKGVLIDEDLDNIDLVVNVGLEFIAKLVNGVASTPFTFVACGEGTTGPADSDTALESEITTGGGARKAATCSYEADYKAKWVTTFNYTAAFAVTEEGIFDASGPPPAGNLLLRHVFPVKNVDDGDTIEFTNRLTVSRAV
ncbi:MAG: hypothetical protein ACTSPB_02445 [Candidatus Thorarchaeota archaeon]